MRWITWEYVAVAILIAARIAILSDIPLFAITNTPHDDAWFLAMAERIYRGQWLGPYNQLTLIKGQGYPLFIAASHVLGLPLRRAQEGLYILSCLMMIAALRPRMGHWVLRVALFAVLLFNPISFRTGEIARVTREAIYPAQTCLVFALAIGLLLRREQGWRVQIRWAVALGVMLGWFWITREEAVWVVPSLLLIMLPVLWQVIRQRGERMWRMGVLAAGAVPAIAIVNAICLMNLWWYGAYITVEFRSSEYLDTYGALLRIDPGEFRGKAVVLEKSLQLAAENSPAFAKVQGQLQGPALNGWRVGPVGAGGRKEFGGLFMWAIRDAVHMAYAPKSAGEAQACYRRIATEVNQACDDGRIRSGPLYSSIAVPWDRRYVPGFLEAMGGGLRMITAFRGAAAGASLSEGTPGAHRWFRKVTRSDFTPLRPKEVSFHHWPRTLRGLRYLCRLALIRTYQWGTPVLLGVCALAVIIDIRHLWRRQGVLLLCVAALVGAILVRLTVLSWIEATFFPFVNVTYSGPLFLLVLCIPVLMVAAATDGRGGKARPRPWCDSDLLKPV